MSKDKKAEEILTKKNAKGESVKCVERRWVGVGRIRFNGTALKHGEVGTVPLSTAEKFPDKLIHPDAKWDDSKQAAAKSEAKAEGEAEALLERDAKGGKSAAATGGDQGSAGGDRAPAKSK